MNAVKKQVQELVKVELEAANKKFSQFRSGHEGWAVILIAAVCVGLILFFAANPFGVMAWNSWFGLVQKADVDTNYETLKQVEDTCRSMIASYEADRLTYEQYKNSEDGEQQSWAEQAKMRANRTASTYNNYILENSYVWSGNVPNDIDSELDYLE